ncbi:MAG TPA: hypothetical protein VJI74_03320, partial [Candidatus Paceibacterota bacterium]
RTLFLFLPSRLHISDVLHTQYIKELADKYRVVVLLPTKDGSSSIDTSGYFTHQNVSYHGIPFFSGKYWTLFDWLLRPECIRRYEDNPAVQWRNNNARRVDRRRRILYRIMRLLPKRLFSTDFFSFLERLTMPWRSMFNAYVKKYQPDLVLLTTPGVKLFEPYIIACAHRLGLPTVAFDFSWDNLTSYPRHVRKTKYLICWNEFHREVAKELHDYQDERLFVGGVLRFDAYFRELPGQQDRDTFLSSRGLDPKRKTVLFAARSYGTFHTDFIRSFIRWQKEGAFAEPLNLFVRIHPIDPPGAYDEFLNIPNVHIGLAGNKSTNALSGPDAVETKESDWVVKKDSIRHSDICVNVASTFSIEAFIFDKPVINVGFLKPFSGILTFPHYTPVVEAGAVRVAEKMEDIRTYINENLKNPAREKEARAKIVEKFVMPTDGYSFRRNIGFIDEIMKRESR